MKALREVRAGDGTVLDVYDRYRAERKEPDLLSSDGPYIEGAIQQALPPGEHELTFVLDAGAVPQNAPRLGLDDRPGQKSRWKQARATWTATSTVKITILPDGEEPIEIVTDPAMDPSTAMSPPTLVVRLEGNGDNVSQSLRVEHGNVNTSPTDLAADIFVKIGDAEHAKGYLIRSANRTSSSGGATNFIIPPDITTADVIYRPNPRLAEDHPGVDQIWGKEIIFKNVPLQRYDLEK